MLECMAVGAGGFIGAICRYLIGLIPLKEGSMFPIKTFTINILGCFMIGAIAALAMKNNSLNPKIVLFLKVGICGGFTTFSSFALEASDLWKGGNVSITLLYTILSITVGILAVFAGHGFVR